MMRHCCIVSCSHCIFQSYSRLFAFAVSLPPAATLTDCVVPWIGNAIFNSTARVNCFALGALRVHIIKYKLNSMRLLRMASKIRSLAHWRCLHTWTLTIPFNLYWEYRDDAIIWVYFVCWTSEHGRWKCVCLCVYVGLAQAEYSSPTLNY